MRQVKMEACSRTGATATQPGQTHLYDLPRAVVEGAGAAVDSIYAESAATGSSFQRRARRLRRLGLSHSSSTGTTSCDSSFFGADFLMALREANMTPLLAERLIP